MQNKLRLFTGEWVLFIIILSIILPSCSNNQQDPRNFIIKNGLICTLDDGKPFTGKVSDVVNTEIIEYDVVKGLKDGEFNVFSEAGNKLISGGIRQNKNEGLWQYFYPDGPIESQGYFKDDVVNGNWYWYYPSGKLRASGSYLNGKKNGKWTAYDEYGKVIFEHVFRNDIEVAGIKAILS
jgi:antitoxin component YwqK of YwqJK toxin-antitoxin module